MGLCGLINVIARRQVVNSWKIGSIVCWILFAVNLGVLTLMSIRRPLPAYESGKLFGEQLFAGALAIAICMVMARKKANRRKPPPLKPSTPGSFSYTQN